MDKYLTAGIFEKDLMKPDKGYVYIPNREHGLYIASFYFELRETRFLVISRYVINTQKEIVIGEFRKCVMKEPEHFRKLFPETFYLFEEVYDNYRLAKVSIISAVNLYDIIQDKSVLNKLKLWRSNR